MSEFRNYLKSKFEQEEVERQKKQSECTHSIWSTWCGVCRKVLASDHHINHHTTRTFKTDNRVAIFIPRVDVLELEKIKQLATEFEEITVIYTSLQELELYDSLKQIKRVTNHTLDEELKHMRKYRSQDVKEIQVFLHSGSLQELQIVEICKKKKLKLTII